MLIVRPSFPAAVLAAVSLALPAAPAAATPPYPGLDTQGEARLILGAAFSLTLEKNGDLVLWQDHQGMHKFRVPALSSGGSDLPFYRYQSTMTADGLILLIGFYKGTFTNGDGVPVAREGVKILSDFLGRPGCALVVSSKAETGEWSLNVRSAEGDLPLALEPLPPVVAAQSIQAVPPAEAAPAAPPQAAPPDPASLRPPAAKSPQ